MYSAYGAIIHTAKAIADTIVAPAVIPISISINILLSFGSHLHTQGHTTTGNTPRKPRNTPEVVLFQEFSGNDSERSRF